MTFCKVTSLLIRIVLLHNIFFVLYYYSISYNFILLSHLSQCPFPAQLTSDLSLVNILGAPPGANSIQSGLIPSIPMCTTWLAVGSVCPIPVRKLDRMISHYSINADAIFVHLNSVFCVNIGYTSLYHEYK